MSDRQLTEQQVRTLQLADYIEKQPERLWDIKQIGAPYPDNECGTAGCILGHAGVLWGNNYHLGAVFANGEDAFASNEPLGLSTEDQRKLYLPHHCYRKPNLSKDQAVRVLRHLAVTGKVDWTI